MATNNGIIRLSNLARYDENIKNYITSQMQNVGLSEMVGSTESANGKTGTVPPPHLG